MRFSVLSYLRNQLSNSLLCHHPVSSLSKQRQCRLYRTCYFTKPNQSTLFTSPSSKGQRVAILQKRALLATLQLHLCLPAPCLLEEAAFGTWRIARDGA